MFKKVLTLIIITISLLSTFIFANLSFAATPIAEYLCEFGISFYKMGRYDEALHEFKKVLMLDPNNKTAQEYIIQIFEKQGTPVQPSYKKITRPPETKIIKKEPVRRLTREEAINQALQGLAKKETKIKLEEKIEKDKHKLEGLKITGATQISLAVTPQDTIWKQANNNLNEEDSRILSNAAFNRRTNTFDTRIYDRLKMLLDTDNEEGFNFHGNITVDPWSFTGKSPRITVTSDFGDTADVELKYWSNTGYTKDEIVFSNLLGNTFSLPEIKVNDGKTNAMDIGGAFFPADTFHIPATKIDREFQPIRELWFDYKEDDINFRFFPIAYQDQAYTSDDPLRLSNNRTFWQQSPWLDRWQAGRINNAGVDFTRGRFDDSFSYGTRDSDGTFLTALRGFSFEASPAEDLSLNSTFASPKGLWQDYDSLDNIINATRVKYRLLDNLSLGSLFTYRLGLNEDKKRDTANYLWGADLGYEPQEGVKLDFEVAASRSQNDLATPDFKTKSRGNAYYFSLIGVIPRENILDLKYGYNQIKPDKSDSLFTKYRFYLARMENGFKPELSNYRETRDDTFWGRHIHFRKPFQYYYAGLYSPTLTWDDIEPYRIGNGIDIGRNVVGFRVENSLLERNLDNLFDIRTVYKTNGKFVENVARDEVTYRFSEQLTTKLLGIYHKLPKTKVGFDPFIFDKQTDLFVINNSIEEGKDPSLKTGSLGLEYAFNEWVALSGIWERTNDYTLAYDNFPRGDLSTSSLTTFSEFGRVFRRDNPSLFSQDLFPLPPYPFYDIWKAGLRLNPFDNLEIYLDYTRNEFKSAGYIDDNINHIGLELTYLPTKKFGLFLRYTFSRWNDINRMNSGGFDKIYLSHHNFFTEFRYMPGSEDEFVLQYGESGRAPLGTVTYDPFGGSLATLDTRHIVRMYYRRRF